MSRADKDAPIWVAATWWRPEHNRCQHSKHLTPRRDCDLPDEPVVRHHRPRTWRGSSIPGCHWAPISEKRRWYDAPPDWFINHQWDAPERSAARIECREAIKEYRAGIEVETEPTTRQHRHNGHWEWS